MHRAPAFPSVNAARAHASLVLSGRLRAASCGGGSPESIGSSWPPHGSAPRSACPGGEDTRASSCRHQGRLAKAPGPRSRRPSCSPAGAAASAPRRSPPTGARGPAGPLCPRPGTAGARGPWAPPPALLLPLLLAVGRRTGRRAPARRRRAGCRGRCCRRRGTPRPAPP